MFFGKKRRKKSEPESFDETWAGDDFGFDADTDDPAAAPPAPPASSAPPPVQEEEFELPSRSAPAPPPPSADPTAGRSLDDATFVGKPPAAGTPDSPPLAPSHSAPALPPGVPSSLGTGGDEDLPDATMVIGGPVDVRSTAIGWLVAASGEARGRDYRLQDGATRVGGAPDSDVRLSDEYASTRHAEVRVENRQFLLYDLQSTNGTFRNDERIQQALLQDGDRVRFGLSEFVFKCVHL